MPSGRKEKRRPRVFTKIIATELHRRHRKSGLARAGWQTGVCVGDYDNDGWDDLFCCFWGHNILFHNNGNGTFTDVTKKAGVYDEKVRWGAGCTFLDYDRDGHLDLFVCNYIRLDPGKAPSPTDPLCQWKGIPVMCGPRGMPGDTDVLFHNNGDGTFSDVVREIWNPENRGRNIPSLLFPTILTMTAGRIFMFAVDSQPSILFRNNHDGTFTDVAVIAGVAYSENGTSKRAWHRRGRLRLRRLVRHFQKPTSRTTLAICITTTATELSVNVTFASGVGINNQYVAWGCGFIDYDNDGWPDIMQVNGTCIRKLTARISGKLSRTRAWSQKSRQGAI